MYHDWTVFNTYCGQIEVKSTKNIYMLREVGQTSEYPHYTVRKDSWGKPDMNTLHFSDPDNEYRFGMREIAVAAITIATKM